ncbi:MAG: SIR2 family protein [Marinilabiliales bacterium]|nr:SIR2 family protein [Marinilabiliales bacterium]
MENTIFFGNGINRLSPKNISWSNLLNDLKESRTFDNDNLPNTMIYERIILEKPTKSLDILNDEFATKRKIADLMSKISAHQTYIDLYNINAQNYLTTNYDYAFIKSLQELKEVNFQIHEYSSEDVYSIRRLKRISNVKESKKHFWQIHGEIRKPATLMLGLDHYCGEIGKIDNYIKGTYRYTENKETITEISLPEKLRDNKFNGSSWIELFFNSNIHIIGFSFDYAEIDLWWIINKRARMKKSDLGQLITNEIIFYCDEINEHLKGVLLSMDISVNIVPSLPGNNRFNEYYKNLTNELKIKIK